MDAKYIFLSKDLGTSITGFYFGRVSRRLWYKTTPLLVVEACFIDIGKCPSHLTRGSLQGKSNVNLLRKKKKEYEGNVSIFFTSRNIINLKQKFNTIVV